MSNDTIVKALVPSASSQAILTRYDQRLGELRKIMDDLDYKTLYNLSAINIYDMLGRPNNAAMEKSENYELYSRWRVADEKFIINRSVREILEDLTIKDLKERMDNDSIDYNSNDDKNVLISKYIEELISAQRSDDMNNRIISVQPPSPMI